MACCDLVKYRNLNLFLWKCTKTVATRAAPFRSDMHQIVCQLDTEWMMHELSVDLEVTFRKVVGSAEILTRCRIDPFEDTRPMDKDWSGSASTPSNRSSSHLTTITSVSLSLIAPCVAPGLASSTISMTTQPLHLLLMLLLRNRSFWSPH